MVNGPKSILELPTEQLTPGMRQYQECKRLHPDCLIMLRMGDFYEMFYEDAITAARELEITLTARGMNEKRAPLAGVPFHALDTYLSRLIKKGYKVAIVEQLEDPKLAKGLVKRGLVRIVTPGTVMESNLLEEKENNYLLALTSFGEEFALAFCDLSTGEFFTTIAENQTAFWNELARLNPSECLVPESLLVNTELITRLRKNSFVNSLSDYHFHSETARALLLSHFKLHSLDSFGLEDRKYNIAVSGGLLRYLLDTQKNSLPHLQRIALRSSSYHMLLDAGTIRNLELLRNIKDGTERGTLLSVLDRTVTAMGSRLLRKWLKEPLLSQEIIIKRWEALAELNKSLINREELIALLENVFDLERLISRINYGNATPRDLLALRNSLQQLPTIKSKLSSHSSLLHTLSQLPDLNPMVDLINRSIKEDAPLSLREGHIIKPGFNSELDELMDLKQNSKKFLQALEEKEKAATGISTLHLGYTRVFGYFIEVTKKNLDLVPAHYIRKQTTANSERYVTEDLKIEEEKILGAEEKIVALEYDLFQQIIQQITAQTVPIQETAGKIAVLDVLCALAKVAQENNYVQPELVNENVIQLRNCRHPVIEKIEPDFIPNDVNIFPQEMLLITGPNMSGKSTLMRQVALITLMAQVGSYVPAEKAVLGVIDRIFTRVGAYDDLTAGQSTFMVEMSETAAILHNATERSLIVLDEIGRGTSTFDGVSLAWSVAEHIYGKIRARTMFSTHYHVLNKLAEKFSKVKNYHLAAKEVGHEIVFLYKFVTGGTDQSYGVHVAKLAGLPPEVILRAQEIQTVLEQEDEMIKKIKAKRHEEQKSLEGF